MNSERRALGAADQIPKHSKVKELKVTTFTLNWEVDTWMGIWGNCYFIQFQQMRKFNSTKDDFIKFLKWLPNYRESIKARMSSETKSQILGRRYIIECLYYWKSLSHQNVLWESLKNGMIVTASPHESTGFSKLFFNEGIYATQEFSRNQGTISHVESDLVGHIFTNGNIPSNPVYERHSYKQIFFCPPDHNAHTPPPTNMFNKHKQANRQNPPSQELVTPGAIKSQFHIR